MPSLSCYFVLMIQTAILPENIASFNEEEWLKLLFLLNDTQTWLNELINTAFLHIPVTDKRKLSRKTYYITVSALAHILERHYFKIQRHPGAGKFTIPITDILSYLRDAFHEPTASVTGTLNVQR